MMNCRSGSSSASKTTLLVFLGSSRSNIAEDVNDWSYSVYGNAKEQIPDDVPEPLGKPCVQVCYVDANLYHDLPTGHAVSGILHLLNGTPVEWFLKRQPRVKSATYGSEFVAARIATDQIIAIRHTLRYLGVAVTERTYMFGDNESVVKSSTIPHTKFNKRHLALAFHCVREAIASKIIQFTHISGKINPADVLSKHCGYTDAWPLLRPLLFWYGDTNNCVDDDEKGESTRSAFARSVSDGR